MLQKTDVRNKTSKLKLSINENLVIDLSHCK